MVQKPLQVEQTASYSGVCVYVCFIRRVYLCGWSICFPINLQAWLCECLCKCVYACVTDFQCLYVYMWSFVFTYVYPCVSASECLSVSVCVCVRGGSVELPRRNAKGCSGRKTLYMRAVTNILFTKQPLWRGLLYQCRFSVKCAKRHSALVSVKWTPTVSPGNESQHPHAITVPSTNNPKAVLPLQLHDCYSPHKSKILNMNLFIPFLTS